MRLIAMFEQVQTLPGSQPHPPGNDRDADRGLVQGGLDMRGHIVRPFHRVPQPVHRGVIARRHKAAEEFIEITPDVRIGIFLDGQRRARVLDEKCKEAGGDTALGHEAGYLSGDLETAVASG